MKFYPAERVNMGISAGAVAASFAAVSPHFAGSLAIGAVLEAMNAIRIRDGELHVPREVLDESGWSASLRNECGYTDSCFAPVVGVLRKNVVEYLSNQGEERSERAKGLGDKNRRNEAIRTLVDKGKIKAFDDWLWWTDEW